MAEVALNLTKEAVSPETEAFRHFCKLQIFETFRKTDCRIQFAVKCPTQLADWEHTYTLTHIQTTITLVHMRQALTTINDD